MPNDFWDQAAATTEPDFWDKAVGAPKAVKADKAAPRYTAQGMDIPLAPEIGRPKFPAELNANQTLGQKAGDLFRLPARGVEQAGAGLARLNDPGTWVPGGPPPTLESAAQRWATPAAQRAPLPQYGGTVSDQGKNALSDVIEGTGKAALPFALPALAAAPEVGVVPSVAANTGKLGLGLAGGAVGAGVGQVGSTMAGGSEADKRLAGDVGATFGGVTAAEAPRLFKINEPALAILNHLNMPDVHEEDIPALDQALAHTKAAAQNRPANSRMGIPPSTEIQNTSDVKLNAKAASDNAQSAYHQWLSSKADVMANPGQVILDAFDRAIPLSDTKYNPAEVAAERDRLWAAFNQPMSVFDLDRLRMENGVASFYNKTPGAQYSTTMQGQDAAIQAARRSAISNFLYNILDPDNNGANPAYIKSVQQQLIHLQDAAHKGWQKSIKEQPVTDAQAIARGAQAPVTATKQFISGEPVHVNPIAGKTNAGIAQVFRDVGEPEPFPLPAQKTQPSFPLLGPSTLPFSASGVAIPDLAGEAQTGAAHMNAGPRQLGPSTVAPGMGGGVTIPDIVGQTQGQINRMNAMPQLTGATPGMPAPNQAGPFTAGQPSPGGGGSTITGPGQPPPLPQLGGPSQIQQPGLVPAPQTKGVSLRGRDFEPGFPPFGGPPKATHIPGVSDEMIQVKDKQTGRTLYVTKADAKANPSLVPIGSGKP